MHFTEHQGVSKFPIQVLITMCLRSHRWNDYRLPEEYISEEPPTFVFLLFMDSAAGKIPSLCFLAFRNVSSCFVCLLFFFSQTHVFCLVLLLSTPQLWSMSYLNLLFSHSHQTLVFCFVAILLFFSSNSIFALHSHPFWPQGLSPEVHLFRMDVKSKYSETSVNELTQKEWH